MTYRLLSTLLSLVGTVAAAWADQEVSIQLNNLNHTEQNETLGCVYASFRYSESTDDGNRVMVTLENITQNPPYAIMLFRYDLGERILKEYTPRIEFDKIYSGEKNMRQVYGFDAITNHIEILAPTEKLTFYVDVPYDEPLRLRVPLYVAKYDPQKLAKKGKNEIKYKILLQHIFEFEIQVDVWRESDPEYVRIKEEVEEFIASMGEVTFCDNAKHQPPLLEQQLPYREHRDSLVSVIDDVLRINANWMNTDDPHLAYSYLRQQLVDIDFDSHVKDCGSHKRRTNPTVVATHSCAYCSYNTMQKLFHKIDDTYQLLYAGRITKEAAVQIAKGINNCYRANRTRQPDGSYGGKIQEYYNRIVNF